MADLSDLSELSGEPLSAEQIRGILAQIDLDVANLLRDGKLAALKYAVRGGAGVSADRAQNLKMLLAARRDYERLLREAEQQEQPGWIVSQANCGRTGSA